MVHAKKSFRAVSSIVIDAVGIAILTQLSVFWEKANE